MALTNDNSDYLVLKRKPRITGWFGIVWRIVAVIGLIGFLVFVHWLERDGLKDTHDGEVGFIDVLYFTMISATTTGYGDIVPVTPRTRLFDAFVVTPVRIFFLLIFIGSAYLFVARRSWERFLMKRIQRTLHDHIVVAGYGTKNRRAVDELIDLGADPENIVIIDTSAERLARAKALGCTVLQGDAARDETIRSVHVERARLVIISAGRDDTSILICLTVRDMAPKVRISIAVNEEDNVTPARRAGADVVVNPLDFAGLLLATTHAGQHIADYLADLASMQGKVRLIERDVRPDEIGKSLRAICGMGVRVIRDGKAYGFWRPQVEKLESGDVIMEITPTAEGKEPSPA